MTTPVLAVRRELTALGFRSQDLGDDLDTDPIGELDSDTLALIVAMTEYESGVDVVARALSGKAFNDKHPRGPDGKFLTVLDRVKKALDDHHKNGGKGDPFSGFDREQLRKAAKARGIQLKRGEDRDSIVKKLIADLSATKPKKATPMPAAKATPAKATPVLPAPPGPKHAAPVPATPNNPAIQAARDVANRVHASGRSHHAKTQIDTYGALRKADFDAIDPATRTWIIADLQSIVSTSRGPNGGKAQQLLHRFTPAGTPAGVVPKQPVIPPKAAKIAKVTAPDLDGTPGLLKVSKDKGASGDGWFHPPGGGPRVWGKYGAAGLLLRHRGDDGVDRYLMVQRGPAISDPGKWQFPGGAIDSKETPFEGATREVLEELGFKDSDLAPGRVHGTHEASVAGGTWKYTSIAATVPTQIKPDLSTHHARAETSDAKWMTADEIRQLDRQGKLLGPLAGGKLEQNVLSLFPPSPGKKGKASPPPLPVHKPSRGRDLVSDKTKRDKLRQDVKHDRQKYAGKVADDRLAAIAAIQGYDDVPTVASKSQIDKLLATGDYIEAWRGVKASAVGGKSAKDIQEELRSGPAYFGRGVFGNGYYLATQKSVAEGYSDRTPGSVVRVLIPKSALVEPHTKVKSEARAIASPRSKAKGRSSENGTLYDEGRYAAAKGIDGIRIESGSGAWHVAAPGKPAYNWVNRSVLIVQEA